MATDGDSKKLCNLRVVDLRAELEKRGLDKTGVKANLIERLQKVLVQEGKDPEEYEFDLIDIKLTKSDHLDEHSSIDQSTNDSSILMIETPNLDLTLDIPSELENEKEVEKNDENTYVESPLNLSIGAEDENLLLNSGDEHEKPTEDEKTKVEDDDKTAVSNHGASSDNSKNLDNACKEQNDDKNNDERLTADVEEQVANGEDATTEGNRNDNMKCQDSPAMAKENTTSGVPIDPSATAKTSSENEKGKDNNETDKTKSNPGRSLWVTNLLPSTRAQELKHLLSRYGKVIGAKVVQSSRYPRQRCYGNVTMETRAAADLCIEKLNNTKLKGQIIRVAKVRPEHSLPTKSQKQPDSKDKEHKTPEMNGKEKSVEKKKTSSPNDKKYDIKRESRERESRNTSTSEIAKKNRSLSKSSGYRPDRKAEILTFNKIRDEPEHHRQRERALREEEKRRREIQRARDIEKRHCEEAMRLEREREKLRIERERLDRQRAEIMRLERERQRLEREKLEQEKQELRRQQMRLEEARRPVKRPSSTSSSTYKRDGSNYSDDRKRIATERHYDETPPPPRFDVSSREPAPDVEIMRLEIERQRLEREKLEQEKQELRRQHMQLEEARRPVKRPSSISASTYRRDSSNYSDDRKRIATERHYDETPPSLRFDVTSTEPDPEVATKKDISKDYKSRITYSKRTEEYPKRGNEFTCDYSPAERHISGHPSHLVHNISSSTNTSKYESSTYVSREREHDIRDPGRREDIIPSVPPPRISKDTRYGERSGDRSPVSYRPVRDERDRRPVAENHAKNDIRSSRDHRYTETALKEGTRYRESNSWHSSGSSAVKPFSSISGNTNSSRETWGKSDNWHPIDNASNERWGNSSSRLLMSSSSGVPNTLYSGGNSNMSGMGPGMTCIPPPDNSSYSMDRFDSYKPPNSSRRYYTRII